MFPISSPILPYLNVCTPEASII